MSDIEQVNTQNEKQSDEEKFRANFANSLSYMKTAKLILKDMEKVQTETTIFKKYKKSDIIKWLETPESHQKELRNASIYLYNSSNHYKRLIQYFANMALFSYLIVPSKLDMETVDIQKFKKNYQNTLNYVDTMNIKHEFLKIMTTLFREDVFYGYEYSTKDSYFIKKLPPDYCQITSTEDGVNVFSFDFSYFNSRKDKLAAWGDEFQEKYDIYSGNTKLKWQEISSANSICIKLNEDIEYPIPPFIGVLSTLYDLEDYKALKKTKEEVSNYKLLSLKIPLDADGNYLFDYKEAERYYNMLGAVLPENIGLALTPMDITEHSFERSGQSVTNAVSEAEEAFWSATGTSSLIFSSAKSGSSVINNSIKSDEEIVFSIFRQFERWVNYKLKRQSGTYKFKIQILDVTIFNKEETLNQLEKLGTYGYPVVSKMAAVVGDSQNDATALLFLENDVLNYHSKMIPLSTSHTISGEAKDVGKPKQSDDNLDVAGEITREQGESRDKLVD